MSDHAYVRPANVNIVERAMMGLASAAASRAIASRPDEMARQERMRTAAQRASQIVEMQRGDQRAHFQPQDVPLRESQGWVRVPEDPPST